MSLPWRSYSVIPKHSGKSKSSHTQNALSSKIQLKTPTEGYTTAAQGDHRYDVRTLEADKPAVAGSVPLIWLFSKPSDADVNSRLWDACRICPAVFAFVLYITCRLAQCHSVGAGSHRCQGTVHSLLPLSSSLVVLLLPHHLSLSANLSSFHSQIHFFHLFLLSGPLSLVILVYLDFW